MRSEEIVAANEVLGRDHHHLESQLSISSILKIFFKLHAIVSCKPIFK